jgi:hypothetical protein
VTRRRAERAGAGGGGAGAGPAGAALEVPAPARSHWAWITVVLALYLAALYFRHDQVPAGVTNDVAEEALRGLYLVEQGKIEVITFAIGNSAETLYLYLEGAVAKLVGTTTLSIFMTSWIFALACVVLLHHTARRLDAALPVWVTLGVATSSVWLFHYARVGLRTIAAPFFLLAVALLLDRAERFPDRRGPALASGALLGLSLYAYTSCRVLVFAFALHAGVRIYRERRAPGPLARCYAMVAAGAMAASIPNIVFFAQHPREFLFRGSYVVVGGFEDYARNLFWTFLMPLHYPASYGYVKGPGHMFDGASAGLTSAGVSPIHPIIGILFVFGLVQAWRRRREPIPSFLLSSWLTGGVLLGFMGPSLTRVMILLPVHLSLASLGAASLAHRYPAHRPLLAAALAAVFVTHAYAYFAIFPSVPYSQDYFSPAVTPIGQRAAALAGEGSRVLCVITESSSLVKFLTHEVTSLVRIIEFYQRPLNVAEIPVREYRPNVLLVQKNKVLAPFSAMFPPGVHRETQARFDEIVIEKGP